MLSGTGRKRGTDGKHENTCEFRGVRKEFVFFRLILSVVCVHLQIGKHVTKMK